jgi:two-component system, NarL family, sensor kinase
MRTQLVIIWLCFISAFGINVATAQLAEIDSLIKIGDFGEAQKLSLQMLKAADESGDCANEVMANFKNAEITALLKDDLRAIQFCQDGIRKAKGCEADSAYWLCIRYLGGMYFGHDPDSATYYLKLAYELKKNSNWHRLISSTCGMIANNYTENFKDTAQSLIWYERSMHHALLSPDSAALGYAYLRYAAFLGNAGNCAEAIPMMQESYAIFKRMNDTEGMMFSLKSLAQTYNTCNVKDSVFNVMYRILDLQDTIYKNETARKTAEYRTIYETEKKEKENVIKDAQIQQQKEQRKNIIITFIVLLILAILIFATIYYRNQLKLKTENQRKLAEEQLLRLKNVVEAEEKERTRIARELHDGVGHLISAAKMHVESIQQDDALEQELILNAVKILDDAAIETRNISHNLMPSSLAELGLVAAIRELCRRINKAGSIQLVFEQTPGFADPDIAKATAMYRILQEVLNNMIKHAKASEIKIILSQTNQQIDLFISDNGIGFDVNNIHRSSGIGWSNIFARAEVINGKIEITSAPQQGTQVKLSLAI